MKRWLYKKNIDKKAKMIYEYLKGSEYLKRSESSDEIGYYLSMCKNGLKFGIIIPETYIDKIIEFRGAIPDYEKNVLKCIDFLLSEAGVEEAKGRYEKTKGKWRWLKRLNNFRWNKLEKHGN